MTLLWVTEHFVMGRLIETMKINVSMWKLKPLQIGEIMSNNEMYSKYPVWIIWIRRTTRFWIKNTDLDFSIETHP